MRRSTLPFTPDGLRVRFDEIDRAIEDIRREGTPRPARAPAPTPLIFHWDGTVADWIDTRNGPGEFAVDGHIYMIRYRWDTPTASAATVEWELDGVLAMTHTLPVPTATEPHVELPNEPYTQQAIVATVTAVGDTASGLTAFVYFR